MKTVLYCEELIVPASGMLEIAEFIAEHEIENRIASVDSDEETLTLEITYDKENKELARQLKGLIEDLEEGKDDDNEE